MCALHLCTVLHLWSDLLQLRIMTKMTKHT